MLQGTDRLILEEPATSIPRWHGGRFVLVLSLLTVGFLAVTVRLFWLQAVKCAEFRELASRQQTMFREIPARRGTVFDRNLRTLAVSQPVQSLFVSPADMTDPGLCARALARIVHVDENKLNTLFGSRPDSQFAWVKRRLSEPEAQAIQALKLPGVNLRTEYTRRYPQGRVAAHLLGWPDVDEKGREGIELLLNNTLAGRDGSARMEVDSRRRPIVTEKASFRDVRHGSNVVLTADLQIQRFVEEELDAIVKQHNPVSVTCIVSDPHTGRILALANRPTFDPARPGECSAEARQNRAVIASYEPGSIFKPFVMSAFFELGEGTPTERVFCENGLLVYRARRLRDHHPYGWLTYAEVIEKSSNIGMAKVGLMLGTERLYRTVKAFGFGRRTGVAMPGEVAGYVTPFKSWSYYTETSVPMGQEITATPMQLLMAFNCFANGGWLMKPQVVQAVLDPDGNILWRLQGAQRVRRVITERTASTMVDPVMRSVVVSGTGKGANIGQYTKFGKTGTAQKIQPTGGYSHTRFVSSFLCGAPAEDTKLTVLVLVNEPRKGLSAYGGTVAAPPAGRILERSLQYMGVPPTRSMAEHAL